MKRVSRIAALLLSAVLLASLPVLPASASEVSGLLPRTHTAPAFSDVSPDAWYYENVKAVCEYGLMVGKSDSVFDPDAPVTVAEAVTIAARVHSLYSGGTAEIPNPYGEDTPWYLPYKFYAQDNGLTCSVREGNIPRIAFAALISRALPDEALPMISPVEDGAIPDLGTDVWDSSGVYRLYRAGILTGNDEAGSFSPYRTLRRSEAAAILTRIADPALRRARTLTASPRPTPAMTETAVRERIAAVTSQQIFRLDLADFDSDGTEEAFVLTMDDEPGPDGETDPGYLWFVSGNNVSLLDGSDTDSSLRFTENPLCPVTDTRTLYLFTWGSADYPRGSSLWYGESSLWGVSGSRPVPYRFDNMTLDPGIADVTCMDAVFLPEAGVFRVNVMVFTQVPRVGFGYDCRYFRCDPATDSLTETAAP